MAMIESRTLDQPRCLAIIPARSGSVRIPGKNMKLFHGKPILQYTIEAALASSLFTRIVVSTDARETREFAESLGVAGEFRPQNLCDGETGTQAVGRWVMRNGNLGYDYYCIIYATAPMLDPKDLARGFELLNQAPGMGMVYSVGPDGQDAGQFYWQRPRHLMLGDLASEASWVLPMKLDERKVCDINTPEDWARAEQLYLDLNGPMGNPR